MGKANFQFQCYYETFCFNIYLKKKKERRKDERKKTKHKTQKNAWDDKILAAKCLCTAARYHPKKTFNREKTLMKLNNCSSEAESFHRQITSEINVLRAQQQRETTEHMIGEARCIVNTEHLTPQSQSIKINCSLLLPFWFGFTICFLWRDVYKNYYSTLNTFLWRNLNTTKDWKTWKSETFSL